MTKIKKITNEELAERIEVSAKWSRGLPLYDDCQEAVRRLRAMDKLQKIVEALADNDLDAYAADGVTFGMVLQKNAATTLGRKVKVEDGK